MPEVVASALADAKAADDIYGPESIKASDAWNVAEQIVMDMNVAGYLAESSSPTSSSSSSLSSLHDDDDADRLRYKESAMASHHDYNTVVDPQSLDDAMRALMKLEHLARLLVIEKNRLSFGFGLHGGDNDNDKKLKP